MIACCFLRSEVEERADVLILSSYRRPSILLDNIFLFCYGFKIKQGHGPLYPYLFSDQAKQHRRASETDTVNHGGTFNREKVEPLCAQQQYFCMWHRCYVVLQRDALGANKESPHRRKTRAMMRLKNKGKRKRQENANEEK